LQFAAYVSEAAAEKQEEAEKWVKWVLANNAGSAMAYAQANGATFAREIQYFKAAMPTRITPLR
jgi:predicted TIM-barrel enzyme